MNKIIVLVGSERKNGNTERLVQAFCKGASQNNDIEIISVREYKVKACVGCNTCFDRPEHDCFQDDDMRIIYEKIAGADILVIASPVYFYGISSQLKAIVDRLHTPKRDSFKLKKMALLLVAASTLPEVFDAIKLQYQMVLNFFKIKNAGMVLVRGVKNTGDIENTEALDEAFLLGASIEA